MLSQRIEVLRRENEALSEEVARLQGLLSEHAAEPTNRRPIQPGDDSESAPPVAAVQEFKAPTAEVAAPTPEARARAREERLRTMELKQRLAAGEQELEDLEGRIAEVRTNLQALRQELARRQRNVEGFEGLIRSAKGELDHALARLVALREEISE